MASGLWPLIRGVLNPFDLAIFSVLYLIHKPLLRLLHFSTLSLRRKIYALPLSTKYPESIFGFIEKPISTALLFLPFVYSLDIISITLHQFGFDFHVKGDLSRMLCVIYEAVTAGMFITKIKDYLLNLHRLRKHKQNMRLHSLDTHVRRDKVRECTFVRARHLICKFSMLQWFIFHQLILCFTYFISIFFSFFFICCHFFLIFFISFFINLLSSPATEATVDELSSIVVWTLLSGLCLEAMSLEFGFALGTYVRVLVVAVITKRQRRKFFFWSEEHSLTQKHQKKKKKAAV